MYKSLHNLFILWAVLPMAVFAQGTEPMPYLAAISELQQPVALPQLPALAGIPEAPLMPRLTKLTVSNYDQTQPEQTQPECAASEASEATMFAAEKRKTFDKTYKVTAADVLNIDNKFGRIHVNTWPRKEIQVKVEIITRAGTDSKAQEILGLINIAEDREGKNILLKTELSPMNIAHSNNKSFEINYIVNMPVENAVKLKNMFGNVNVANLKGKVDINVSHGSLKTGSMSHSGNLVKVAYGTGNCGFINQGNVEVSYGNMLIEGTNNLQGFSKFSEFKLGSLSKEMDMEVKYGTFRVDNISKDIQKINLNIGFTPVTLNFEDKAAFNFDVNVKFGNFTYDKSSVNITSLIKDHTSAEYKGKFGGTASKGLISINSKFGDVQFSK